MKTEHLLIPFTLALGLTLALLGILGGRSAPAVAAPRAEPPPSVVEGHIEAPSALAAELHVCPSGCAYSSVQAAVDAADTGDVIKVAAGIYTGVSARAGVTQVVYISKTVTIQGGYTATNWTAAFPITRPTTLDAQGRGRVLYITGDVSPTIAGLYITDGDSAGLEEKVGGGIYAITATVTISGCQIIANNARCLLGYCGDGGGIYLRSSGNATLSDNIIQGNTALAGGGVYLHSNDNVTLSGNTIQDNAAEGYMGTPGGGVYLWHSDNATLSGNIIISNTARQGGGVVLRNSNNATLNGNIIIGNTGQGGSHSFGPGGVMLWDSDSATLSGNTIRGNSGNCGGGVGQHSSDNVTLSGNTIISNTAFAGGGVHLLDSDDVTLDNNVIADNQAGVNSGIRVAGSTVYLRHTTLARNGGSSGDGSGVYLTNGSTAVLTNTILVSHTVGISVTGGNTASVNGVLWFGTPITISRAVTTNVTVQNQHEGDPAFATDGYHLTAGSAAINRGVNAGVTVDIDGESRPPGEGCDLGADELPIALRVTKQADPTIVEGGEQLTYTILVTNVGHVNLHATITDTLPIYISPGRMPDGTTIIPGGRITWTAAITAPGGVWAETIVVTVEENYTGLLTNLVEVTTEEGAAGKDSVTVSTGWRVYLPLVMRNH